ncbi:hypothetical protein ACFLYN_04365 [Chloroflexota bacterium]
MKQYTHAWLSLKAIELLKSYSGEFSADRNKRVDRLLKFMSRHPSTFVRGAWFPDNIIKDNVRGGHTWKYSLDPANGREVTYRTPSHNNCNSFVKSELSKKVKLDKQISDLPDRCEALSQTIRDMILITNKVHRTDVILFNDSQIATLLLMLSHYVCDAHVPVHCDKRDLYDPSRVHEDLEAFWEKEIKKFYSVSTKLKQFDLDEKQNLQLDARYEKNFKKSVLCECDRVLKKSAWEKMNRKEKDWKDFLGKGNGNTWDYLVAVCLVSFHMSLKMFPVNPPGGIDYKDKKFRIMETSPYKEDVIEYSPYILADAINSVALVWLATWERWELLEKVAVKK